MKYRFELDRHNDVTVCYVSMAGHIANLIMDRDTKMNDKPELEFWHLIMAALIIVAIVSFILLVTGAY
jgi:hypothetical protein